MISNFPMYIHTYVGEYLKNPTYTIIKLLKKPPPPLLIPLPRVPFPQTPSRHRHKNIKSARPHPTNLPHDDPSTRPFQIIPIAIQDRLAQEIDRRLKAHFRKRARGRADPGAAEGREAAAAGHDVGDEPQVAGVDVDAVGFEDGVHFTDGGGAGGLDAVDAPHGVDVVGEEPVWVDDGLVVVHGAEVDALGEDDGGLDGGAGARVAGFFLREDAGGKAWDGLDGGAAAGFFDEVEHD